MFDFLKSLFVKMNMVTLMYYLNMLNLGNKFIISDSIKSFIMEKGNENINKQYYVNWFGIFLLSFGKMELLIVLFIVSYCTLDVFRCTVCVLVKNNFFDFEIFSFNPTSHEAKRAKMDSLEDKFFLCSIWSFSMSTL